MKFISSMCFKINIIGNVVFLFFFGLMLAGLNLLSIRIFDKLISYINKGQLNSEYLIKISLILIGVKLLSIFLSRQYSNLENNLGYESIQKLICFIFQKIFKVSASDYNKNSNKGTGEIINFIEVDSPKLGYMLKASPKLLFYPIEISLYLYLLYYYLGFSFLAGVLIFILYGILNFILYWKNYKEQHQPMTKKDIGIKLNCDVIENLKFMKIDASKDEIKKMLINLKNQEISIQKKSVNTSTVGIIIFWIVRLLANLGTIGAYQYFNEKFEIKNIMIGLYIFGLLHLPMTYLPYCISCVFDTLNSLRRIEDYLKEPEIDLNKVNEDKSFKDIAIKIENCNFSWKNSIDPSTDKNSINKDKKHKLDYQTNDENIVIDNSKDYCVLNNINLTIRKGEFIGILGEVGSGKSSLIQAIMNNLIILNSNFEDQFIENLKNDLKKLDGNNKNEEKKIVVNGTIAYTSQFPWIQNETLRNNILFYGDFNEMKYKNLLKICNLEKDINSFENKDLIEIGHKGIYLTAAQKTRISLARAVYNERDIYLFDDPLSSLDSESCHKFFKDCLMNFLQEKTRILATNNLNYISFFDRIIWLGNNKQIIFDGKFEELKNQTFYKEFIKEKLNTKRKGKDKIDDKLDNMDNTYNFIKEDINICTNLTLENNFSQKEIDSNSGILGNKININSISQDSIDYNKNSLHKISNEEFQEEIGLIKFSVFFKYFQYMGGKYIFIIGGITMLFWISFRTLSDLWLLDWIKQNEEKYKNAYNESFPFNIKDNLINFLIFAGLSIFSVLFISFSLKILIKGNFRIWKYLYSNIISSFIKAPTNFFEGSIQIRIIYYYLLKDLENLPNNKNNIGSLFTNIFSFFGVVFFCSFLEIYALPLILFLIVIGFFIYSFYLKINRQLHRIEEISRSNVLNIISEAISGGRVIRVFDKIDFFKKKFYSKLDDNYIINIFINGTKNWFELIIDCLSTVLLIFFIVFAIISQDKFTPQSFGLILNYTLFMQYILIDFFKELTLFLNNTITMERCLNFLQIPKEKTINSTNQSLIPEQTFEDRILPKANGESYETNTNNKENVASVIRKNLQSNDDCKDNTYSYCINKEEEIPISCNYNKKDLNNLIDSSKKKDDFVEKNSSKFIDGNPINLNLNKEIPKSSINNFLEESEIYEDCISYEDSLIKNNLAEKNLIDLEAKTFENQVQYNKSFIDKEAETFENEVPYDEEFDEENRILYDFINEKFKEVDPFVNRDWKMMEEKNDFKSFSLDEASGLRSIKTEIIIRVNHEKVKQFMMDLNERHKFTKNLDVIKDLRVIGKSYYLKYMKLKSVLILSARDFIFVEKVCERKEGEFIMMCSSFNSPKYPPNKGIVRAETKLSATIITKIDENTTKIVDIKFSQALVNTGLKDAAKNLLIVKKLLEDDQ